MTPRVEVGFFSFTEITDPGEHRSYNEWHQLDHLPQQYELPGVVLGQRWVSTPECKAKRVFDSERLSPIHYVTLYLMSAPLRETLEGFRALSVSLREEERFHEHRRSRLSGPFSHVGSLVATRALVSAQVLPFRPNRGVYVVVHDSTAGDRGARARDPGRRARTLAPRLLGEQGVAGVWSFSSLEGFEDLGWRPGSRDIDVCYLDEEPLEAADSLGKAVREEFEGGEPPELAGPFETVTPWRWDWFG